MKTNPYNKRVYLTASEKASYFYELNCDSNLIKYSDTIVTLDGSYFKSLVKDGIITFGGTDYVISFLSFPEEVFKANAIIRFRNPIANTVLYPVALVSKQLKGVL